MTAVKYAQINQLLHLANDILDSAPDENECSDSDNELLAEVKNIQEAAREWSDSKQKSIHEKSADVEKLRHRLYEAYKLDWMIRTGHNLNDVVMECEDLAHDYGQAFMDNREPDNDEFPPVELAFDGFKMGSNYANYENFLDGMYKNVPYCLDLLKKMFYTSGIRDDAMRMYLADVHE